MPACAITKQELPFDELTHLASIRPQVARLILKEHPDLEPSSLISRDAMAQFRAAYVRGVLQEDIGDITTLEADVLESLREHELLASNVEQMFDTKLTFGERLADRIAEVGGSWGFIIGFGCFLVVWIMVNTIVLWQRPPDPYPFILLNLILSCLAAIQAPLIMMSQNRQEVKDRVRAQQDYKINLKAELEIRHLHEKVDFLLKQQAQRLFELQAMQIDLMQDLGKQQRVQTEQNGKK